jgi:thiol oxidase
VMAFWGQRAEPLFTHTLNIASLTNENFDSMINTSKKAWVIDFYAPWCPHCQHFAPIYEALADHYAASPTLKFGAVDCTTFDQICTRYNIMGYPRMKIFKLDPAGPMDPNFDTKVRGHPFNLIQQWIEESLTKFNLASGVALKNWTEADNIQYQVIKLRGQQKGQEKKMLAIDARADRLRDAALALIFSLEGSFFIGTDIMEGERYAAAHLWLKSLSSRFPLEVNRKQLTELQKRFESQSSWTKGQWKVLIETWKREAVGQTYPLDLFSGTHYVVCEGYTCGLWLLFHMLSVSYELDDDELTSGDIASAIRGFVAHFFGCEICVNHFVRAVPEKIGVKIDAANFPHEELVLWLFHIHNTANKHAKHPMWPSKLVHAFSKIQPNLYI